MQIVNQQAIIQRHLRGGSEEVHHYINTNKPQFFCRIPVVLEIRRSSQGGVRTPCTLPLDPPLHFNVTMHSLYRAVHMEASLLLSTPDGDAWVTHVRFAQSLALACKKTLFQESEPTKGKEKGTFRPPFGVLHVITSVIQTEIKLVSIHHFHSITLFQNEST